MTASSDYEAGYDARADRSDGSITHLLKYLVQQVGTLFRQEIALARAEVSETAGHLTSAIVMLVVGAILGLSALIVLLFAAVYGIAEALPLWASALVVGGVVAIVALILVMVGKSRFSARNLLPRRTARTLKDDVDLARGSMQ
ncbi:MAG: phage holin family protein [Bauldia sp.]